MKSNAIICSACGEDTFVRREAVYEGFQKVGEEIICVSCSHVYASDEEVPYKVAEKPHLFSDDDRSPEIDIFSSEEKGHNCRHCTHYTVNPFVQRCGLHKREVAATDLCDDFSAGDESRTETEDPLDELLNNKGKQR